jgi:hypothetical protein
VLALHVVHVTLSRHLEKGIPLPENRILLPDPDIDKIIPYLTKGLIYNTLATLGTSGSNLVDILGVLDTKNIAN